MKINIYWGEQGPFVEILSFAFPVIVTHASENFCPQQPSV